MPTELLAGMQLNRVFGAPATGRPDAFLEMLGVSLPDGDFDGHLVAHFAATDGAESGGSVMKPLRILVAMILFAGASLTARAMYLDAKANLASVLIHRAWAKTAETGAPQAPWPWADTHPVARLRIPRIGYDEIVLEGATPRTLAFGPARLFSRANLGEPGNVELAGHRTSWFRPLEALDAGDQIEVQWFDTRRHELRERTYTVNDIRIVLPEEVNSLAPRSDDALTLITCYPFGHSPRSPQRFVVLASPAGPSRSAQTSRLANRAQL